MSSYRNRFSLAGMVAPVVPLAVFALFAVSPAPTFAALVANSKHNLSASGTGTIKATTETEICVFCHAPHNASPAAPLWNRTPVATTYTPYTSSTRKSTPGQPNGASLLCLGCHDGTVALGKVRNRAANIVMASGVTTMPVGNMNLGINLSDDHPVSFVYDAALVTLRGELATPPPINPKSVPLVVGLDSGSRMQCTSCHSPHDNANGKFLVVTNTASALCVTCHTKNYWTGSDHRNSTKTWNGTGTNPWQHTSGTTVQANACENCHRPHTAGGGPRLLNYAVEETNCLVCHSGTVATAAKRIDTELAKTYRHGVASYLGTHDPTEAATVTNSHVECVDCHNPHAAYASTPPAGSVPGGTATPALAGSQIGVRGIDNSGNPVAAATAEYEICYRCHADGGAANLPSTAFARVITQNNKRLEFQPGNPSHHAVAGPRTATSAMPSLTGMPDWSASSRLRCTDCHNNNAGPYSNGTAGTPTGTGPNGPHGSTNPWLLERRYDTADNTSYTVAGYAMCFKCHSSTSILSDAAGSFKLHNKHISGEKTPCSVCHDPHGVSSTQGTVLNNSRLINFRTGIVTASSGAIRWERVGATGGRCYLNCHGKNHSPESY